MHLTCRGGADQPYFAMQFIQGESLSELLEESPLAGKEAARLTNISWDEVAKFLETLNETVFAVAHSNAIALARNEEIICHLEQWAGHREKSSLPRSSRLRSRPSTASRC